jgi:hypothetical protein
MSINGMVFLFGLKKRYGSSIYSLDCDHCWRGLVLCWCRQKEEQRPEHWGKTQYVA